MRRKGLFGMAFAVAVGLGVAGGAAEVHAEEIDDTEIPVASEAVTTEALAEKSEVSGDTAASETGGEQANEEVLVQDENANSNVPAIDQLEAADFGSDELNEMNETENETSVMMLSADAAEDADDSEGTEEDTEKDTEEETESSLSKEEQLAKAQAELAEIEEKLAKATADKEAMDAALVEDQAYVNSRFSNLSDEKMEELIADSWNRLTTLADLQIFLQLTDETENDYMANFSKFYQHYEEYYNITSSKADEIHENHFDRLTSKKSSAEQYFTNLQTAVNTYIASHPSITEDEIKALEDYLTASRKQYNSIVEAAEKSANAIDYLMGVNVKQDGESRETVVETYGIMLEESTRGENSPFRQIYDAGSAVSELISQYQSNTELYAFLNDLNSGMYNPEGYSARGNYLAVISNDIAVGNKDLHGVFMSAVELGYTRIFYKQIKIEEYEDEIEKLTEEKKTKEEEIEKLQEEEPETPTEEEETPDSEEETPEPTEEITEEVPEKEKEETDVEVVEEPVVETDEVVEVVTASESKLASTGTYTYTTKLVETGDETEVFHYALAELLGLGAAVYLFMRKKKGNRAN